MKNMSEITSKFIAINGGKYPQMKGINNCFINGDNPHAKEVKEYMLQQGAIIGWNSHDLCPIENMDGVLEYAAQKPVWVFDCCMTAKAFKGMLKSKGWRHSDK